MMKKHTRSLKTHLLSRSLGFANSFLLFRREQPRQPSLEEKVKPEAADHCFPSSRKPLGALVSSTYFSSDRARARVFVLTISGVQREVGKRGGRQEREGLGDVCLSVGGNHASARAPASHEPTIVQIIRARALREGLPARLRRAVSTWASAPQKSEPSVSCVAGYVFCSPPRRPTLAYELG